MMRNAAETSASAPLVRPAPPSWGGNPCHPRRPSGGRTWLGSGWGFGSYLGGAQGSGWGRGMPGAGTVPLGPLALDEATVRDAMGSLKRRAAEVAASGGAWVKGD